MDLNIYGNVVCGGYKLIITSVRIFAGEKVI